MRSDLSVFFRNFLFISPTEKLVRLFLAPWWDPEASTLFSIPISTHLDHLYAILTPESSGLIVIGMIIALPVSFFIKSYKNNYSLYLLSAIIFLSVVITYFGSIGLSNLNDITRYSFWLIPLFIALFLNILFESRDNLSSLQIMSIIAGMFLFVFINLLLFLSAGGVNIGYIIASRTATFVVLFIQLSIFTMFIVALLLQEKWGSFQSNWKFGPIYLWIDNRTISLILAWRTYKKRKLASQLKPLFSTFIIGVLLVNSAIFTSIYVSQSERYSDHNLVELGNYVNTAAQEGSLIFSNNYIYLRNYIDSNLVNPESLLTLPETEEEFLNLLNLVPNNTLIVISDDSATTWYERGNSYIKNYLAAQTILPALDSVGNLPPLDLPSTVASYSFEQVDNSTVLDDSGENNHGVSYNTTPVEGFYGNALQFNGTAYTSTPSTDSLNALNNLTISFFANIEEANALGGYTILSKGYAELNGSYDIFVWDQKIYFELGDVGSLSFNILEYIGDWHRFDFIYNGETMSMYIDGVSVTTKFVSGNIRPSAFPLEIGRDGERMKYYYHGLIDELQISTECINEVDMIDQSFSVYAKRIDRITLQQGDASVFKVINRNNEEPQAEIINSTILMLSNRSIRIHLTIRVEVDEQLTLLIGTSRFTRVIPLELTSGLNTFDFQYDYIENSTSSDAGGPYWIHMSAVRLIVIDYSIIYNNYLVIRDLSQLNSIFLLCILSVLTIYAINFSDVHYRRRRRIYKIPTKSIEI